MQIHPILLAALLTIISTSALSRTIEENAAALSEAAIGGTVPPLKFVDSRGNRVNLSDFRGKPLLISLVYTGCTDVCPAVIENLYPSVSIAQEALGQDSFTTITVGFDTKHDTPDRMRSFARAHGADLPNWLFLSGSQKAVQKLVEAVGFSIIPSAGGFDHTAQVSVVDADGRIYQQVLGGIFSSPVIVEPLKDLLFNQRRPLLSIGGLSDRIKLFCTVFNPNTGRYYFNYSLFIGIFIGLGSLMLILAWLIREFRLSRRPGPDAHS